MISVARVKDKASDTADQLRHLRAQVEALMNDRVTPAMADAAGRAETGYRAASAAVHDQADVVADQVRERPIAAILIAAGAGYLFGRLFR